MTAPPNSRTGRPTGATLRHALTAQTYDRTASTPVRLLIATDQLLILDALARTLHVVQGLEVVGTVSDDSQIIPAALRLAPTVTILDADIAGHSGLRLARQLRGALPSCGITLIATEPTRALVGRAVAVGVLGVVPKYVGLPHLISAVRGASAGYLMIDAGLLGAERTGTYPLSQRERDVLRLTATGATVKEIAKELFLATGTVRNLASTAMRKLGGRNRFDAARIASERGWL
jgi:two-component system response regulator DesR